MSTRSMERLGSFLGIVGAVILGFGLIGGFAAGSFALFLISAHLLVGTVLVVSWFVLSGMKHVAETGEILTGRTSRFGFNVALYTVVFVALLVTVNWYVNKHDKRWDLTQEGVYSLAPQSRQVVDGLKKPLRLVGVKLAEQGEAVEELLALYRNQAPSMVSTNIIDPRAKPHLIESYGMKPGNLIYLEYGEGDAKSVSRINEASEEAVTNAILKLTRGNARKVYVVQGHDEPSLEDTSPSGLKELGGALEDEHLKPEPLIVSQFEKIPDDAAAVLLIAPKKPLLPQEKESLVKYAEGGGRLLLLHHPRSTKDVGDIAGLFGIAIRSDVIVDQVQRLFGPMMLGIQPIARDYGQHAITKGMTRQNVTMFNNASSVTAVSGGKKNEYTDLVKTGPSAWGETSVDLLFSQEEAAFDDADTKGPLTIAIAYEKNLESQEKNKEEPSKAAPDEAEFKKVSRVVVFGNAEWVENSMLQLYSNRDLALNVVDWLVGEEGGVSIRAKTMKSALAPISKETLSSMLGASFLLPELVLLFGLYVWWGRRREGSKV